MIKIADQALKTVDKILECAKKEFLKKGFKNASLRNIAKDAGVTTGAIYGYFKDKDDIFVSLVKTTIDDLYSLINKLEGENNSLNLTREIFISIVKNQHLKYIDYVYSHFEICKLLFCCSSGSSMENYLKDLNEYIIKMNMPTIIHLNKNNKIDNETNKFIIHMTIETLFKVISEFIEYDVPYEDAIKRADVFFTIFFAGYSELYNLK